MHNAEELRIDRKSTGRLYVPRATCSITGGIQPDTLTQAIGQEHVANGLLARFLIEAPPRKPKRLPVALKAREILLPKARKRRPRRKLMWSMPTSK